MGRTSVGTGRAALVGLGFLLAAWGLHAHSAEPPPPATSLDGVLLFSDTGRPAAGAEVLLNLRGYFTGEENLSWSARADATGRFSFARLPACRTFVIRVRGPAIPLFQAIDVVATGLSPRHLGEIRIQPGVCRQGRVCDRVFPERGEIWVEPLPPGRWSVRIKSLGPYLPVEVPGLEARPLERTDGGEVPLVEGASLVIESKELAEEHARGSRCWSCLAFRARTAGGEEAVINGEYTEAGGRVEAIPAGSGTLEIEPGEYYPFRLEIADLELGEERRLKVTLDPYPLVEGRLILPPGVKTPAGSFKLKFIAEPELEDGTEVELDREGSFKLRLPPGRYRIEIREPVFFSPPGYDTDDQLVMDHQASATLGTAQEVRVEKGRDRVSVEVRAEEVREKR